MSRTGSSLRDIPGLDLRLLPVAIAIAIATASLSVHVVMLQVLGVPYPDMSGVGRFGLVLVALRILALLVVCRLALPALAPLSAVGRIAAVALIDMAVAGNVRAAVMEAVVTTDAAFAAIELPMQMAQSLVLAVLVVVSTRLTRRLTGLLSTTLVLTGATTLFLDPIARAIIAPFAHLRRPEVYTEPYGAYVLAWSYATFLETAAAAMAIAILVGTRLSKRPTVGLLQFVTLILLLRGTLVMQLLFPWSMRGGVLPSMLSTGQFFLQDLVLAVLAWLAWRRLDRTGDAASVPPPPTLEPDTVGG